MKRYMRTKDNKFYDTSKERYLVDGERLVLAHEYETHPTMTDGNVVLSVYITTTHIEYKNCGTIDKGSDDIIDLLQDDDIIKVAALENSCLDSYYSYELENILIDVKHAKTLESSEPEYLFCKDEIIELYTKQGNDYKLVWTKEKGVI